MRRASFARPGPDSSASTLRQAGYAHQQCLRLPAHLRPRPETEAHVGGDQPDPADTPQAGDVGGDQGGMQRGPQPFRRDGPRLAERAADVLVVDERLDQAGSAAQRGGLPAGLQIAGEQFQQLLGGVLGVSGERGVVDAAGPEPGPGRDGEERAGVEVVVADDVGYHVAYSPPGAQGRRLPLLRCQGGKERGEIPAFVSGQPANVHSVHGSVRWVAGDESDGSSRFAHEPERGGIGRKPGRADSTSL